MTRTAHLLKSPGRLVIFAPLLLAASALYLVFIHRSSFQLFNETYFSLFDDAMVSMRYARNLAQGSGLVWNPGEPAVEGFTNFLWVLYLTALHLLPVAESKVSLLVMLSGMILLLALVVATGRLAWELTRDLWTAWVAAAAIGTFFPLLFWTLRGMEVGLVSLLMTLTLLAVYKRSAPALIGLLLALLWLARPDTLLFSGGIFLYLLLDPSRNVRRWLIPGGMLALSVAGLTIFRFCYFGEVLPNTFFLKMGGGSYLLRYGHGLHHLGNALIALAPFAAIACLEVLRRRQRFFTLLLAVFALQGLYSVHCGGDAWEWMKFTNRYLSVAFPALCILFSAGVCRPGGRKVLTIALVVLSISWANYRPYRHWIQNNFIHFESDVQKVYFGLLIRKYTAPDAQIAVTWAGAIPYFARRSTIDLLGKNDSKVAKGPIRNPDYPPGHQKWNYSYSIAKLAPDIITSLWRPTEQDMALVLARGYQPGFGTFLVRKKSRRVSSQLRTPPQ